MEINKDLISKDFYTHSKVLWAGSKYSTNDTMTLSSPMVLGKFYCIEFYGKSGTYKDYKIYRSNGTSAGQVCQINFYSVPDASGFRYRIETSDGQTLTIAEAQGTSSNCAITAIYLIE